MAVTNLTLEGRDNENTKACATAFPKFCGCEICRSDVLVFFALNHLTPALRLDPPGRDASPSCRSRAMGRRPNSTSRCWRPSKR